MSSRKETHVTGCKGWVSAKPFGGATITRECLNCGLSGDIGCQEFRKESGFIRIRDKGDF